MQFRRILENMKARSSSGELSSSDKEFIKNNYKLISGKNFTPGKCKQYYQDAFIEMYTISIKKGLIKADFKLKNGVVLRLKEIPEVITNKNITNGIALKWLQQNPGKEGVFSYIPLETETFTDK